MAAPKSKKRSLPKDKLEKVRKSKSTGHDDSLTFSDGAEENVGSDYLPADISKAFLAKRKRLEIFTKSSLKASHQMIEQMWKAQQNERFPFHLNQTLSDYINKISVMSFESLEELQKTHRDNHATFQTELRQEMALLQKKILMETQQQDLATVRQSLQTMLL
ncbi:hypothetical protein JZ751_007581 [Albula glossodonta]|uniref:XLR/SYCP3/FAM9 domain-containing protein n=1 Tax=Albula glossodonta TaxID=121402 RepID=A0A8T2N9L2_9TELE|nr:hypothetical protein JZ751_007581 [Albula glossodonta]